MTAGDYLGPQQVFTY